MILLLIPVMWHQVKWWSRFYYLLWQSKRLQSFKVILPRSDSKVDQEKRTEKDFKEKVAIMEQLYRALYEIKDLNIWQYIHFYIFRNIIISFEVYIEDNLMTFYVVTIPSLATVVEKQITTYYPDAEVAPQDTPDIWPKGNKFVAYNIVTEKSYMYPIRYYEQMQDDPLNGMANVLSKLKEGETAGLQVILTPTISEKYGKETKEYASQRFKGKKSSWIKKIPILGTVLGVFMGIATGDTKKPCSGCKFWGFVCAYAATRGGAI